MPKLQLPAFPILFATALIDMVGFGIVVPTLPFYMQHLGGNGFDVGMLLATFSLGMLVAAPLWGKLSDRIGRRPALLIALLGNVAAYAGLAFTDSIVTLVVLRFFAGLMSGNLTIVNAYVTDITAPHERTRKMGTLGIAFGMGFMVGPAVGALASHFGLLAPMFVAAGLSLLNFISVFFGLPEPHHHVESKAAKAREVLSLPLLILFCAGAFGMGAFSEMQAMYAVSAEQTFGWGPKEIGYSMTYVGLMIIVFRLVFFNRLVDFMGEKKLMLTGFLLMAVGLALFPHAPTSAWLVVISTFFPFGMGSFNSTFMSLVSREALAEHRGFVLGLSQTALGFGNVGGPLVAGWLFDVGGTLLTFSVAAGIAVTAALIGLAYAPSALALRAEHNPK